MASSTIRTALRKLSLSSAVLAVSIAVSSCDNFGFHAEPKAASTASFTGVKSINITPDGRYVLLWDLATGSSDVSAVSYEIYMDKWTTVPTGVDTTASSLNANEQGIPLGARFTKMVDSEAPVTKGVLLSSVRGARSYTLDEKIQAHVVYAFQVRLVNLDGSRDTNDQVLIYSADLNKITFDGVSSLTLTEAGKILVNWEPPTDLAGISPSEITYEIYMDSTTESVANVMAGKVALDVGSGLSLLANDPTSRVRSVGTLVELAEDRLPSHNVAPIAEKKGGRYYEVENPLSPGTTYIFQVQARGPTGEQGSSAKAFVYRREGFTFDGLAKENVTLAPDASKISLTWDPAEGGDGSIIYTIYTDANFTTKLTVTTDTSYDFLDPVLGQTYVFGVRASDGSIEDTNRNFVAVPVPKQRITFAGLKTENVIVASDQSKISMSWSPATGNKGTVTYIIYSDANFSTVLSTTTTTSYELPNPTRGLSYTFAARAKDGSLVDDNHEFVIVTVPDPSDKIPPFFAGLVSAEATSDRKILLKWAPSSSSDVSIYNIYNAYNLTQPIASTAQDSYTVSGLSPATSYSFVVRAKDASGNEEKNTIQKTAETLSYAVPDFAGLKTVERLGGMDGLSKLKLTWLPAGGTVTGYKVYKSATLGGQDYSAPFLDVPGANSTTATITGLASNTAYYFVVRAYDSGSGSDRAEQNTIERTNSTLEIKAPTFAGATTAAPGAGSLGFTTAKVTWGTPSTDGVYDGFAVQYEAGTCAQGFTSSPTAVNVAGDSTREYTLSGLTAQTTYRFRVKTRYSVTELLDSNSVCKEAYTSPPSPVFDGLTSVATASGISGFASLVVTWPQATSSFSYYKVDWSTSSTFASIGGTSQVPQVATLNKTLTGLPTKSTIYVRVAAVFDEGSIQLSSGETKVLSANTTPTAPTGEGISGITVTSSDSLKVDWTAPTNAGSSVYNGFKLWKYCGASAPSQLQAKLNGAADHTYPTGQLQATFSGLSSNVECCYQLRAYYDDGVNTLVSGSTIAQQCKTPTLVAPTFAGVSTVTNGNQATGFSQLTASWTVVSAGESGLFSYYELDWATTPTGHDWAGTIQITDRTTTSKVITGLSENTTYYVRVRAVNNNGSPSVSNGADAVASAATTPKAPTGDNLSAVASIGSTKAQLTYAPPNSNADIGGLSNGTFLFVQAGTTTDVASYRTSVEAGGITAAEVSGSISGGRLTLSSLPALVRVPPSEITADQNNSYELWGLTPNQQVCIQAISAYWVDGQATKYLASTTPTTRCVTPNAGPPVFSGVTSLTGYGDSRDFTQMIVNWGAITGDCTGVEISATLTPSTPNFTTPIATATCGETSKTIAGLTMHKDYYVQVRALNVVGGTTFPAGQGTELTRKTRATVPTGDGMSTAVASAVAKSPDSAALTYVEATAGVWNKIYIWRATGSSQSAAQDAVRLAAVTKVDNSGPTSAPLIIKNPGSTTATDAAVTAGPYHCYLARAVYTDGVYYNASVNETTKCDRSPYTTPTFLGVGSGTVTGTWSDGTAKIELTLNVTPAGSIEEYWVYFSPSSTLESFGDLTAQPWQKFDFGDATYDANPNDNKILIGGQGKTVAGSGYYLVRYKYYYGNDTDTNTAISSAVTVSAAQSNLVYVPPSRSGLSYDYYVMQYEASVASGSFQAGDSVTATEADLATCNYEFHSSKTALHATCGTHASDAVVTSIKSTAPSTATWHQAWMACRNSGSSGMMMRLATAEEWNRAAKWVGTSYQTMWDTYSNNAAGNCVVSAGSAANTGSAASCKSAVGAYDVAGNLREWVDSRMVRYDTTPESRFSYAPTIGRTLKNGIENISRRYHLIDPGASGLALALGADYTTPSPAERKQYGVDVQSWTDPTSTTATGFRCVALAAATMPTMAALALPSEPVFASADHAGAPSTWVVPENLYAKDTRWENVAITVNGNVSDAVAEGKVTITWKPWSKTTCTPTCASSDTGLHYKVYRFVEPTLMSERLSTPWALTGGSSNPYGGDKPLDPLATDGSGNALYTGATTDGALVATITDCSSSTPANCTFEDSTSASTGFSTRKLYNYVLVVEDNGNQLPAVVQRWRSPYFTGNPAAASAATFRLEPRYRRAAVFLVDEEYQQARTRPQIMVHVPMNKSGLDHDFFIQKYEASGYDGTVSNNTPAGASDWPIQASSGTWSAKAGQCQDSFLRTASFADVVSCGNGTAVASTTRTVQSKQGVAPLVSIDQGAFWKACRNTGIADEDGNTYYLSLPTDSEWMKAADWGDVNLDGTIDQHEAMGALVGQGIGALEYTSNATGGDTCHTDNNPGSAYNSNTATTAKCRSRFGAADMVGNVWEWTLGQIYNGVGYDNGVDGLWLAGSFPTSSQNISSLGRYDLFRAFPKSAPQAPAIVDNGDYYWYSTALRGAFRGGAWNDSSSSGRWALYLSNAPSDTYTSVGGRCRR